MNEQQAPLELDHLSVERSDEEVAQQIAQAYPEVSVETFVDIFLDAVDLGQFEGDTGHVDCPVACLYAALAYQKAGGQFIS